MVNNVGYSKSSRIVVRIDAQGRIVIPAHFRRVLDLKPGSSLVLYIRGNTIVLTKCDELERRVEEWYETIKRLDIRAFSTEAEPSFKWMSEEYVRRKLGLD